MICNLNKIKKKNFFANTKYCGICIFKTCNIKYYFALKNIKYYFEFKCKSFFFCPREKYVENDCNEKKYLNISQHTPSESYVRNLFYILIFSNKKIFRDRMNFLLVLWQDLYRIFSSLRSVKCVLTCLTLVRKAA